MSLSQDVIEQVKLKADIIDVVQGYIPSLKKYGSTWKACCPFHQEKTPSFTVNPTRQTFKCFGCGKGGNAISFVMELEQLSFVDAVELLARKYDVYIPETQPSYSKRLGHNGGNSDIRYGSRDRLCLLHEKLSMFYRQNLVNNPDSPVSLYFKSRGIPDDVAEKFKIGAAPDSWDASITFAKKNGFIEDELMEAGIVSAKEENDKHIYDRFRNRLMFPIFNEQGRIVGFSARSIEKNPQGWKYVNSPETSIFRKGHLLYALNFARQEIPKHDSVIVCEGQLDTIAWHRAGFANAVAPQGTAFTPEQANILKRHTNNVILALDNDKAGHEAVRKDADILIPLGFSLKVASYSQAKDADETISKFGPGALKNVIDESVDFFTFMYNECVSSWDVSSPDGKTKVSNELISWIVKIPNQISAEAYLRWLSEKLSISMDSISLFYKERLNYDRQRHVQRYTPEHKDNKYPQNFQANTALSNALKTLLQLVVTDETIVEFVQNDFQPAFFGDSTIAYAIEQVIQAKMNGEWSNAGNNVISDLLQQNKDVSEISSLLSTPLVPLDILKSKDGMELGQEEVVFKQKKFFCESYLSCLREIHTHYLKTQHALISEKINSVNPDSKEWMDMVKKCSDLSKQIKSLDDFLAERWNEIINVYLR